MTMKSPRHFAVFFRFKTLCNRYLLLAFAISFGIVVGQTQSTPTNQSGCSQKLDSLKVLFNKNDPRFLLIDFANPNCRDSEKHYGFYHQGLGYLILSDWKNASLHFEEALSHPGEFQELALYHLWQSYEEQQDSINAAQTTLTLNQFFPQSRFLKEMLSMRSVDQKAKKSPTHAKKSSEKNWGTSHFISNTEEPDYSRFYMDNRLQYTKSIPYRNQFFSPSASISASHEIDTRELSSTSGNFSLTYMYQGFFATTNLATSYDYVKKSVVTIGGADNDLFTGWNWPQIGATVGFRFSPSDPSSLSAFLSANRFHPSLQNISLTTSSAYTLGHYSHTLSLGGERVFYAFPSLAGQVMTIQGRGPDTSKYPLDTLRNSEASKQLGLWGADFSYGLEARIQKVITSLTLNWRYETDITRQPTDSAQYRYPSQIPVPDEYAGIQSGWFGGPSNRGNLITLLADANWEINKTLSWRISARGGIQRNSVDTSSNGRVYRFTTTVVTRF